MCMENLNIARKMRMERVLEFADTFELKIANTFKKAAKKLVTCESERYRQRSQNILRFASDE